MNWVWLAALLGGLFLYVVVEDWVRERRDDDEDRL